MNAFSFLSTVSAAYFVMIAYQRVSVSKMSTQNVMALLVLFSLAWWCGCDAFFYIAPSFEDAWFWHRVGAPGWCGFAALTSYYFLVMTGYDRIMPKLAKVAFWIIPLALTVRFACFSPTGIADSLVQSTSGLGWTYVQSFSTVWPYAFLSYVVGYLGIGFWCLSRWRDRAFSWYSRHLAKGYMVLDTVAVLAGFVSLYVVPFFTIYLPPMGFAAAMVFGIWYWMRLRDYDFEFVELALNPSYVYESCIDGLVVTDDEHLVLYANSEACRILGEKNPKGRSFECFLTDETRAAFDAFSMSGESRLAHLSLRVQGGTPATCSVNRTMARTGRFELFLVHLSDVSQLQEARDKLEYLAYHDAMTGVSNRRRLDDFLAKRVARAEETSEDFVLLFIDVADFKQVNDTYGHRVGDASLRAVAAALENILEPGQEIARFAGDEFVVLGETDDERSLVDRIEAAVGSIDGEAIAAGLRLAVDVGSCRYSEAGDGDTLLSIADARMYARKRTR